jgi:DNA-binding IclR family transcriptional regulator
MTRFEMARLKQPCPAIRFDRHSVVSHDLRIVPHDETKLVIGNSLIGKIAGSLRLVARGPVTVTLIARELGMPKSSASRLLKQLAASGILEPVGPRGGYRAGFAILAAAGAAVLEPSLVDRLDDLVRRLAERFGHTGYVSVLDGDIVKGVRVREGTNLLRVVTPVGHRYPAFATSTGRALLARLEDGEVRRRHPAVLVPPSAAAPQTLEELLDRLADVRRAGIAFAEGEANRGTGNLAVAVMARDGEVAAACISFPASICDGSERARIAEALINGATAIGALVSDPFWTSRRDPAHESERYFGGLSG